MTSKQRKLKYIREKNDLRNGKAYFIQFVKVPNALISDEDVLKMLVYDAKKDCFNKWKLDLKNISITNGYDGFDFIRDLITVKIKLSL